MAIALDKMKSPQLATFKVAVASFLQARTGLTMKKVDSYEITVLLQLKVRFANVVTVI